VGCVSIARGFKGFHYHGACQARAFRQRVHINSSHNKMYGVPLILDDVIIAARFSRETHERATAEKKNRSSPILLTLCRARPSTMPRTRRNRQNMLISCFAIILLACPSLASAAPRPVIVDSDLGSSADDNFALALALASKHLDVVLVVVTSGDTLSSARVATRQLRESGRVDVPIAIGLTPPNANNSGSLRAWGAAESLDERHHTVEYDGPRAMADILMKSPPGTVDLLVLGPSSTVAAMLRRFPEAARGARAVVAGTTLCSGDFLPESVGEVTDVPAAKDIVDAEWGGGLVYVPWDVGASAVVRDEHWNDFRNVAKGRAGASSGGRQQMAARAALDAFEAWRTVALFDQTSPFHELCANNDPNVESIPLYGAATVAMLSNAEGTFFDVVPASVGFNDTGRTQMNLLARAPRLCSCDSCVLDRSGIVLGGSYLKNADVASGWTATGIEEFRHAFRDAFARAEEDRRTSTVTVILVVIGALLSFAALVAGCYFLRRYIIEKRAFHVEHSLFDGGVVLGTPSPDPSAACTRKCCNEPDVEAA
jgi:inosine-uridine nucleoside N-ribohydrolase